MTGYGRSTVEVDRAGSVVRFVVEVRSVNHRGFDLKIRTEEPDAYCDSEITRVVRTAVERGAVSVAIRGERSSGAPLDVDRIRRTYSALERIRRELDIGSPVDLGTVAAFLTPASTHDTSVRGQEMWQLLRPAVDAAVAELLATRGREGQALRAELATRAELFSRVIVKIQTAVEPVPLRFARRLQDKLAALSQTPGFDPGRAAQEVALMAERLDVSEELLRLHTHLDHLRELLGTDVAVGRRLDFVIQEIARELNTVGSKAQDAAVAAQVIEAKAELEKIREQAQNIE